MVNTTQHFNIGTPSIPASDVGPQPMSWTVDDDPWAPTTRPAPRTTSMPIPSANAEPLRVVQVDEALNLAREKKIAELKVALSDGEHEENFLQHRIQKAVDDGDEWEAQSQQMKLAHCIEKQRFYSKWLQETREAETVENVKTVVETMVADQSFQRMEKAYEMNREEFNIER